MSAFAFEHAPRAGPGGKSSRTAPSALAEAIDGSADNRVRTIASGTEIYGQGESADFVSRILEGMARTERVGAADALHLPMTRRDIADALGLTIHTVSRTLSQLQAEGLVELESLRRIRLTNVSGLHAVND